MQQQRGNAAFLPIPWHGACNDSAQEPHWLLEDFCENTDFVSFVSCHLGDRPGNDHFGQHAAGSDHTIDYAGSPGAATVFVARYHTSAADAADLSDSFAVDARYANAVERNSLFADP